MADVRKTLLETRKFKVVRVEQLTPDGRIHEREIVVHPGAVTIIPMVDQNHVCLIKNFRVAVGRILIELPAGTLEPNEDPTETARRELTEETGYHAEAMTSLSKFCMSPGILDEVMYLYLAQGLSPGPRPWRTTNRLRPTSFRGPQQWRWQPMGESKTLKRWSDSFTMIAYAQTIRKKSARQLFRKESLTVTDLGQMDVDIIDTRPGRSARRYGPIPQTGCGGNL